MRAAWRSQLRRILGSCTRSGVGSPRAAFSVTPQGAMRAAWPSQFRRILRVARAPAMRPLVKPFASAHDA